jgi:excisionase family DNA binding protein
MLSPQQAADQVQVSRRTIMIAIESQELKATRNNKNHWKIRPEDLEEWLQERGSFRKTETSSVDPATSELKILLEVSQNQIKELREDRDTWRSQALELSKTLKNLTDSNIPRDPGGVGGIFRRFFRGS